jgi:choline dehydrogenase-like flavoprotein
MSSRKHYDAIVVGSGSAGSAAALSFLEEAQAAGKKNARLAIVEAGIEGERYGASRWTGAYLRFDKNNEFDPQWIKEVATTNRGLADLEYAMMCSS